MEKLKYIVEDSILAELLGVQNFSNKESAILELVKNAFDANALTVKIVIKKDSIEIVDDGCGMNRDDLAQNWIRIKEDYIEDETINGFYNQLQLVHQTRRLDYLLINMQGLHKKLEGTVQGGRLAEAILTMQRKRNKFVENECVM